jgi:hypothetical protein
MQRPNRVVVLFAMPLAIFIVLIGWILLSAGSKQKIKETSKIEEQTFILQHNQQILA